MKAAKELLGDFAGILITDWHGAYHAHPASLCQLCWSHVIRNLERLSRRNGDPGELGLWLARVARIVIRLEHRWRGSGGGYQSQHYRRRLLAAPANFRLALEQGLAQHAGQRSGNACQALLHDESMLWRFLETPGIDLTNNTAERALRPSLSGGKPASLANPNAATGSAPAS
ncbi:hypothetical protein EWI61_08205 [Methylolobus aquaticus]|nr:hypothetical protein EWI61_08205 [Methylolobus aquaticus]